jgi:hypothetical protein
MKFVIQLNDPTWRATAPQATNATHRNAVL